MVLLARAIFCFPFLFRVYRVCGVLFPYFLVVSTSATAYSKEKFFKHVPSVPLFFVSSPFPSRVANKLN